MRTKNLPNFHRPNLSGFTKLRTGDAKVIKNMINASSFIIAHSLRALYLSANIAFDSLKSIAIVRHSYQLQSTVLKNLVMCREDTLHNVGKHYFINVGNDAK